jgi:hypothetical protein
MQENNSIRVKNELAVRTQSQHQLKISSKSIKQKQVDDLLTLPTNLYVDVMEYHYHILTLQQCA